ncbi:GSCOCG00006097001-RA-CDS [Cotesia congregata]|uniref:Similar to Skp1: S-phase kinase-associated protein 1 (Rattus norvegicus) n=1 Tax=Cotesia congregata TaxID=51543 RepID=A0A8J2H6V9_COTCN|nr:GSCOCG00006097001-RA-CDS [Cotesia congregata]CAG5079251.1 Similar to Skp1: S-phase kinase-associated protein 1 (Rattus norvegicus) [Cotesia congregata]CAG5079255.1 Similar to Skp1: S-phase kinase-associated protein 1 (Rattus norvegicus) [Cotesia congregata]CAG5079259.1 Similar to Skp1: S-phase kinase-associated protein 1 (Rattus norvegicus) [Cotesia congregata]
MTIIKLQSNDGVVFEVDVEIAKCLTIIKTMLEILVVDESDEETPIPLPNVHSVILEKIIQWATHHHKDDPPFVHSCDEGASLHTDEMCSWDAKFYNMEIRMLFDLIKAANYLDIKFIFKEAYRNVIVALLKQGFTHEQVKNLLHAENIFDSDEDE